MGHLLHNNMQCARLKLKPKMLTHIWDLCEFRLAVDRNDCAGEEKHCTQIHDKLINNQTNLSKYSMYATY